MVHSVMRRGVEDEFKPSREFAYRFCVDPVLIDQTCRLGCEDPKRFKPDQWHPSVKHEGTGQFTCPGLAKGSREIVFLRGVMYHV